VSGGEYDFVPWFGNRWFRIGFCKTWFFGYQSWRSMVVSPRRKVLICLVPLIGIEIGLP
jgi:hypothetical protein